MAQCTSLLSGALDVGIDVTRWQKEGNIYGGRYSALHASGFLDVMAI